MIQIEDKDTPITAAEKLIRATTTVKATIINQAVCKVLHGKELGETVELDMYDDDDLKEIADHIYLYLRMKPKEDT